LRNTFVFTIATHSHAHIQKFSKTPFYRFSRLQITNNKPNKQYVRNQENHCCHRRYRRPRRFCRQDFARRSQDERRMGNPRHHARCIQGIFQETRQSRRGSRDCKPTPFLFQASVLLLSRYKTEKSLKLPHSYSKFRNWRGNFEKADEFDAKIQGDVSSKESMLAAFKGAYAVFAVTNYWEKMDYDLEVQQGKNLADAALESGVQHFIWSSLRNVTERSYSSPFQSDTISVFSTVCSSLFSPPHPSSTPCPNHQICSQ